MLRAAAIAAAALSITACSPAGGRSAASPSSTAPQTMGAWISDVVGCLQSQGWDVKADPVQMSINADTLPRSQVSAFKKASADCEQQAGPQPNDTPITAAKATQIYEHLLATKSCLEEHGFSTSEPPSRGAFVDDYLNGRAPWTPYSDVRRDVSEDKWQELNRECPQSTDS